MVQAALWAMAVIAKRFVRDDLRCLQIDLFGRTLCHHGAKRHADDQQLANVAITFFVIFPGRSKPPQELL